jgi:hypothetical protein
MSSNSVRPVLFLFPQEREMFAYTINNATLMFSKAYGSRRKLERKYQNAFVLSHDGVRKIKQFRVLKHRGDSISGKLWNFIVHAWEIDIQYSDLLPYSLEQIRQLMVNCAESNNWNCYGIATKFDSFVHEITNKSSCLDELFTLMKLPEDELDDILSL